MLVDHVGSCCGNTSDRVGVNFIQDQLVERIYIYKLEKVCMYVCMWPLLKLLDLAVLVVLWWCKTRRGAILAVLVVLWGVRWVLVVLWGSGGFWW